MNPPFSARLPLEMFYRIRDIDLRSINSRFLEGAIHDFARRPDKRFARDIFVIARLFADEHHLCAFWTFAKHRLGGMFVKVTRLTIFRCLADSRPTRAVGRLRWPRKLLIRCSHLFEYESQLASLLYSGISNRGIVERCLQPFQRQPQTVLGRS